MFDEAPSCWGIQRSEFASILCRHPTEGVLVEQPGQRPKEEVKKPYESPVLTRYGDIEELTHGALHPVGSDALSKL